MERLGGGDEIEGDCCDLERLGGGDEMEGDCGELEGLRREEVRLR